MPSSRAVLILALCAGALLSAEIPADDRAVAGSSKEEPRHTRVFYLQGMGTQEAVSLLRSLGQVRQIAEIRDLDVVIVAGVAEKVDLAESLLRQRDAVARAVDPHEPLSLEPAPDSPLATRVFRIEGLDTRVVVTLMRAIYQIRQLTESPDGVTVSVRAPLPRLDASEALLRELGLVVEVAQPAGT